VSVLIVAQQPHGHRNKHKRLPTHGPREQLRREDGQSEQEGRVAPDDPAVEASCQQGVDTQYQHAASERCEPEEHGPPTGGAFEISVGGPEDARDAEHGDNRE